MLTGFITAKGRESEEDTSGFVFKNCEIKGSGKAFLGRVVFYETNMSSVIVHPGWDAWKYKGQDYLIAAFNQQGIISAFVDGKSSHDEAVEREMGPEEFSKLRVVVVVFSKNYALHVSFLEKQILEYSYRNNNDFVVVPVFYGVSVSSVKQHMERFVEEFDAVQRSMIKWRPGHEYDCKR
ncbi:predicted protein, partial [Arabidopsis lyrata subsp. lyrata]